MIAGAYALALYARPRNTGDIDIFIGRTDSNADLMMSCSLKSVRVKRL